MAVEDINADVVRAALAEHDEFGLAEFCQRYGFDRSREYVITIDGNKYGTTVIVAAAHGRLPGCAPLRPQEVNNDEVVNAVLEREGFTVSELRPPPWTREELILACSLLFKNHRKPLRAKDQQVKDLSALLQQLPYHPLENRGRRFRSPSSVQRKLYDLMTRLPSYTKTETRAGQLDGVVLKAFRDDEDTMHAEAEAIKAANGTPKAWALFSSEDRKYGGNTGYADVLGIQYVYDNKVPNYLRVGVGDLVVIRDDTEVHGVGRIQRIEQQPGAIKPQRVCPKCETGRFDERKVQRPRYRCRTETCHTEFDELREKFIEVTQFVAFYGASWRPLDGAMDPAELKSALLDQAAQNAIRSLDPSKLQAMLTRLVVQLPPPPIEDDNVPRKQLRGGRRTAMTKVRNGQGPFRQALLKTYGSVCAVTGACPVEVLQAAHIRRFAEHGTHEVDEGVLLRADIHLLFDNGLLAVDPDTWRVVLAPSLGAYQEYAELTGAEFIRGPNPEAIRQHFEEVTATWI